VLSAGAAPVAMRTAPEAALHERHVMGTETFDLDRELAEIATATEHLLATARRFSDSDAAAPSLLPGWTRGHVLTHVARNADSLCNLLTWAATGVETPQYSGAEAREADIEAGAQRAPEILAEDVRRSAARFAEAARSVPAGNWTATVRTLRGTSIPASRILWQRLKEVQIHHVDLDGDYTPAHWPPAFVTRALDEVCGHFDARRDVPALRLYADDTGRRFAIHGRGIVGHEPIPTVTGPEPALLAWLIGRTDGDGLLITPHGPLPDLPSWL